MSTGNLRLPVSVPVPVPDAYEKKHQQQNARPVYNYRAGSATRLRPSTNYIVTPMPMVRPPSSPVRVRVRDITAEREREREREPQAPASQSRQASGFRQRRMQLAMGRRNSHSDLQLSGIGIGSGSGSGSGSEAKISTLLDSMLNLCGASSAAEAVRDAICDSDRKAKSKKKGGGRSGTGTPSTSHDSADSYMARLEPHAITSPTVTTKKLEEFPKISTAEMAPKTPYKHKKIRSRSTSKKLSRRKSRRSASANQKDSIFRGNISPPHGRPSSDTGAPFIGSRESLRAYANLPIPNSTTEFSRKQSDRSILSSDSRRLLRSFSSNKLFEMEEEAIGYEKESRGMSNVGTTMAMSAGVLSDDDYRMSDQAAPIVTKRPSLRRKNSSRIRRDGNGNNGLSKSAHGVELPPLPRRPP